MTLPAHVARWASLHPDRPAIVTDADTLSYRRLDDRSARLAGWLAEHGVRAGDRVGVFPPNGSRFVVALLAVLRLGAVHVPVNPMFRAAELRHELNDAAPELVITRRPAAGRRRRPRRHPGAHRARRRRLARRRRPRPPRGHRRRPRRARRPPATPAAPPDRPRAANTPSATWSTRPPPSTTAGCPTRRDGPRHRLLCYLPVFWIAGENLGILAPLVSGGTSVLLTRWNAGEVLRAIETHRVSTMAGTVENYLELLDHPDFARHDLTSLTAPLTVSFIRKLTPSCAPGGRRPSATAA
ncbi:AMP-binding protein [Streptomyces sp. KL116D]|uniref:AMP-binding protein n=1 Tax=Streptomyces sp. KL116D TaxID=3045152 RepID=UPI00355790BA